MNDVKEEILKGIESTSIYELAITTPLEPAPTLSRRLNNEIFFKREDLQPVFSFKIRGAFHKMTLLSTEQRKRGVITASAGNHAQGVALGAQKLGIIAVIVMPVTTPEIKVNAVKALGAKVVLHGDSYDDALERALQLRDQKSYEFIHPFDDPEVIAGQGTIAKEIIAQIGGDPIDALFVAVGGGGLLAGILTYIKELHPHIKVVGVESEESACLYAALKAGKRVCLDSVGIFADGVAVKQIGKLPFELIKDEVDEVITASIDEICSAIKDIYEENRTIQEPAGALGVAGMKKYIESHGIKNQRFVVVNCGANMNFDRLQHIAERTEIGANREMLLSAQIPEVPGAFRKFCESLGDLMITEFNYRYADITNAQVFVGIGLQNEGLNRVELIQHLTRSGYLVDDMSDNDAAKLHVRHMVGGRVSTKIKNERLYRFQFPERPGALLQFLKHMNPAWNISLFHYRNHGSAYGRVLVGIQVAEEDMISFQEFLEKTGYRYFDETDNVAYKSFLKPISLKE
jgi:threonine dehydratase